MNGSTDMLSLEIQKRLDRYLDAVERALTRVHVPRSERRYVVDDVESQVRDMLKAHTGGSPTLDELESVIGQMDPPQAYAEAAETAVDPGGEFEYVLRPKAWLALVAAMVIPVLLAIFNPTPAVFAWVVISLLLVYTGSAFVQSYLNKGRHDRVVLGLLMVLCDLPPVT